MSETAISPLTAAVATLLRLVGRDPDGLVALNRLNTALSGRPAVRPDDIEPGLTAPEWLHSVASDLRHVASGGECDEDTLRAHAKIALRLAARLAPQDGAA
jgi:hypothetical protein